MQIYRKVINNTTTDNIIDYHLKMPNIYFSSNEIRLATATLASIAALAPALYYFWPTSRKASKEYNKTFEKLIQNYSTLRAQALTSNLSRDFAHHVLPLSLNLPTRDLQSFQKHATMIFSLFTDFKMVPQQDEAGKSVHFSPESNTVIAHCKMGGKVNSASDMGQKLINSGLDEWWTECVLFVRMSEHGDSIVELREFVNSARAEELQKRLSGVLSN